MSLVQFFDTVFFEKVVVSKSTVKLSFFFFFLSEKTECLTSTYKSGGLSCKLPK